MSMLLEAPPALSITSRFAWLMGLHAENHLRLTRLFQPQALAVGRYVSSIGDGLDVTVEVIERHRYTLDLSLRYGFAEREACESSSTALLRMYRDARMTEVLECRAGGRFAREFGPLPPAHAQFETRWRMSTFLGRWLEYLAEQGHSAGTLQPAEMPVGNLE